MNELKHICNFNYCRIHKACLYANATTVLKNHPYKRSLGAKENADIIVCYQKEDLGIKYKKPTTLEREIKEVGFGSQYKPAYCEHPKCNSVANTVLHKTNLCFKCLDLLRAWKTNYELGVQFNSRYKLIKLFKVIDELIIEPKQEMIRCINIYCGTTENMTSHHLIPKPYRKHIKGKIGRAPLCDPCHKRVHRLKTNGELAREFNTKGAIIALLAGDISFRVMRVLSTVNSDRQMAVA